jgi:hypothetical protein
MLDCVVGCCAVVVANGVIAKENKFGNEHHEPEYGGQYHEPEPEAPYSEQEYILHKQCIYQIQSVFAPETLRCN